MAFGNKYRAVRTCGRASKLENAVYEMLKMREKIGAIRNIEEQCTVVLQDGPKDVRIKWKVDFCFEELPSGRLVFCEAKGKWTQDFVLKLKMFKKQKIAALEIWGGNYRKPTLLERFEP